jgi:hypothetical protein
MNPWLITFDASNSDILENAALNITVSNGYASYRRQRRDKYHVPGAPRGLLYPHGEICRIRTGLSPQTLDYNQ